MKVLLMIASFLLFLTDKPVRESRISNPDFTGTTPRLTTDAAGNPLLSWVEKKGDKEAAFYFATSLDGGQTFGPKINVKTPATLAAHAEGMPKIAMKADGTLLAVFEVPAPTPESRFAGNLLYVMSVDKGQTWTSPKPVHENTNPGTSHSYSDITRLPNGEIGIVWLDEKLPGREGRPVTFAQTTAGKGFGEAILVDDNACQCCRTNVFVDTKKQIHLTYRDLLPSHNKSEPAARDISHAVSADGGRTFSKPQVVFSDQWQVNACPHAGPSVAQVGNDVLITWFSEKEEAVGLRLARLGSDKLVSSVWSNRAKHPQVTTMDNRLVWVWDESVRKPGQAVDEPMPQYTQRIAIRTTPDAPTTFLTPNEVNAAYPAVLATKNGLLVAYEQTKEKQNPVITIRLVDGVE